MEEYMVFLYTEITENEDLAMRFTIRGRENLDNFIKICIDNEKVFKIFCCKDNMEKEKYEDEIPNNGV